MPIHWFNITKICSFFGNASFVLPIFLISRVNIEAISRIVCVVKVIWGIFKKQQYNCCPATYKKSHFCHIEQMWGISFAVWEILWQCLFTVSHAVQVTPSLRVTNCYKHCRTELSSLCLLGIIHPKDCGATSILLHKKNPLCNSIA